MDIGNSRVLEHVKLGILWNCGIGPNLCFHCVIRVICY